MEKVKSEIDKALSLTKIEIFDRIKYQVRSEDQKQKEMLKMLLNNSKKDISQNNNNEDDYFTIVEIDFVKSENKISRKSKCLAKFNERNNERCEIVQDNCIKYIEEFNFREDGPIIKIYNSSIFVYGEYIKISRSMSQAPLVISGTFKTEKCVSDFIYGFKDFFKSEKVKFMASGKEDIDVRCLQGRPFIVEIINPTKNLDKINNCVNQINSNKKLLENYNFDINIKLYPEIDIINTKIVKRSVKDIINKETPDKLYNLLLYSKNKIIFDKKYEINQKTPLRVLHRRANINRTKVIEVLNFNELNTDDGFYYTVDIKTASGTYVKEWVNGDFNRTIPNLNADLLELDVIKVEQEIPEDFIFCEVYVHKLNKQ